jgi:Zn-dependent peptidase ImmA (M78 family)
LERAAYAEVIEGITSRMRADWKLGKGPISNMVRLLERYGCVVVRTNSETKDIDAFSGRWHGRPYDLLASEKGDAARSRFDAAHELGHLVMHPDPDPTNREHEVQAHLFASAFLMPRDAIRHELPRAVDWPELIRLKARWKVSLQALLRRGLDVGSISNAQYRRGMAVLSARGWRKLEPGDAGKVEDPQLLAHALQLLEQRKGIRWPSMAERVGLGVNDLRSVLRVALPEDAQVA